MDINDKKINMLDKAIRKKFETAFNAIKVDDEFSTSMPFLIDLNELIDSGEFTYVELKQVINETIKLWANFIEPRFYSAEFDSKANQVTIYCTKGWGPVSFARLIGVTSTNVSHDEIIAVLDFVKRLVTDPEFFVQHHGDGHGELAHLGVVGKSALKRRFYARFGSDRFEYIFSHLIAKNCFVKLSEDWFASNGVRAMFVGVNGAQCAKYYEG